MYNEVRADSIRHSQESNVSVVDVLSTTACSIALDNNVDIFVCLTETGKIAKFVAKYRPFQTILACSTSSTVVR